MLPNRLRVSRSALMTFLMAGFSSSLPAQGLQITAPQNGATVVAGQTLNITVDAPAGAFRAVQIIANNGIITQQVKSAPYGFSLTVPPRTLGALQLTALGVTAPDQGTTSAPVAVTVIPPAVVTALQVDSTFVFLNFVGNQKSVLVHGAFSDGTNIDIPRNALTFTSSDAGVAVATPDGFIRATGAGTTTVIATYGGHSVTLTVTVPTLIRGDLNGDGQVDQLDLQQLLLALNKSAAVPGDARDLNADGKVDALDARIETTLCTYARCATNP